MAKEKVAVQGKPLTEARVMELIADNNKQQILVVFEGPQGLAFRQLLNEDAKLLVGEAVTVLREEMSSVFGKTVTLEQIRDLIDILVDEKMQSEALEFLRPQVETRPACKPEWLSGLFFNSSFRESAGPGERDLHLPIERPLEPGDILSFRETETQVHLVAADGRKHVVDK